MRRRSEFVARDISGRHGVDCQPGHRANAQLFHDVAAVGDDRRQPDLQAVGDLLNDVRTAGFAVRHMEDLTDQWKEYYLEALWREEWVPRGKGLTYVLFVCERMGTCGSG